jgi:hypothetical protein
VTTFTQEHSYNQRNQRLEMRRKMCIAVRLERSLNEGGRAKAVMLLDQCVLRFPTHILWS